jgi:hypothetical protein
MFFSSHDQLLQFLMARLDIFCQPSPQKTYKSAIQFRM